LIDYLRSTFNRDIRAIVPQLALSGGTMICLASKVVIMSKHSSLGPVDPQVNSFSVQAIIEEWKSACTDIQAHPERLPLWREIVSKYHPTLVGECVNADDWTRSCVKRWLSTGMLEESHSTDSSTIERIVSGLGSHAHTKVHGRHFSIERIMDMGVKVEPMEKDPVLYEAILSAHRTCMETFYNTRVFKLIENHLGHKFLFGERGPN
jgi:hypothetical protein